MPRRLSESERITAFWEKVNRNGPIPEHRPDLGPCWLWTASQIGNGYGHLKDRGRNRVAHHVAYELLIGPLPPGKQTDHLCQRRPCVNPYHLEPVTQLENLRRGRHCGVFHSSAETCPHGHPLVKANLYGDLRARRQCGPCNRTSAARYRNRDRERYRQIQNAAYARRQARVRTEGVV